MAHCAAQGRKTADPLEGLKALRCPACRAPVVPLHNPGSPLVDQVRAMLLETDWRPAAEALLPARPAVIPKAASAGPLDQHHGPANTAHPNGAAVLIDMPPLNRQASLKGTRGHSLHAWKQWYLCSTPAVSGLSLRKAGRVAWNCVTLRNMRCFSRGVSPRSIVLVLLVVFCMSIIMYAVDSSAAPALLK